ncbi:hypothetical protein [Chondromyces apiculatus]|uniref:hypothetical protein n=1 Tax=Chondromyces apiculatus TaxID=51 RepID=UPI0012DEA4E9|nr:hypothetical protein [Chondromyces apiculatus]
MAASDERAMRAQARRMYPGEIVRSGTPKPNLYADLTLEERFNHQAELVARQHGMVELVQSRPRHEWPGEVFWGRAR